jgi:hypothetical protein
MNTYSEDNDCPKCNHEGEIIFHQYVNSFSCQWCGFWWDFGVDIEKLTNLLNNHNIKRQEGWVTN